MSANGAKPVLVRRHGVTGPPGLLADWLEARGLAYAVSDSWSGEPLPDPREYAFIVSLGCRFDPRDTHEPQVAAELELLRGAVEHDVPVLGLCFGGQALAAVLGGAIEDAPAPELGWRTLETDEPDLVPEGPWLLWHFQRFTLPPGAVEVARTADAPQAFRHGRHLGVQFHPESTVEIVAGWAAKDTVRLAARGIDDPSTLIEAPPAQLDAARDAAFRLFDGFIRGESE